MLPGLDVAAIRHYCEQHVPPHAIEVLRTEVELTGGAATILECRAPWREDFGPEWTKRGVARPQYTPSRAACGPSTTATETAAGIGTT